MVESVLRPRSLDEAAFMAASDPGARYLSGGTFLLSQGEASVPRRLIAVDRLLPKKIEAEETERGKILILGAGLSFQDILDSAFAFPQLKAACLSMVDRNVRNRATVGGNIGAAKSCSSLIPLFLALDAEYLLLGGGRVKASEWDDEGGERRLILHVRLTLEKGLVCAFGRYSRTACDISSLTCAVAARRDATRGDAALNGAAPSGQALGPAPGLAAGSLRICLGGLGPKAARFPALEKAITDSAHGGSLPPKETIEEISCEHFSPRSDARGSAEFKRLRAAVLLADTLHAMEAVL